MSRLGLVARLALTAVVAFGIGLATARFVLPHGKKKAAPAPISNIVEPQPQVVIEMASWFPSSSIQLGAEGQRLIQKLEALSGGKIDLRFNEPGRPVPREAIFDSVGRGEVDAGWATPGQWFEKDSAFALFSAVPFGPNLREFLAWFDRGGGRELAQALYAEHNIVAIPCGVVAPEGGGWFRKRLKSVKDLQGLKIRTSGLTAEVYRRIGAEPVIVPPGETYYQLEKGQVDAAEVSQPAIDLAMGFHRVLRHYYFPGWQQQIQMVDLMLSQAKWNELPAQYKTMVEVACGDNIREALAVGEAAQPPALAELEAKGVMLERFPQEMLNAFREAWDEVAAAEAARNENFKRVWDSYTAFRDSYAKWRKLGTLD